MFSDYRMTAVIVEDEKTSQEYLTDLLATHFPQVRVLSIEDTVQPAVKAIDQYAPDIVFLDVEIKMGTGFDVLAGIKQLTADIIFTTAFNQFAIDAFRYHAVDYLLKPLESERVIQSIERSIRKSESQRTSREIMQLLQYMKQSSAQQRLPVSTMYGMEFIDTDDILFAEAEGNYSKLKLKQDRSILVTKKIKELEEQLPEPLFIRIHHSYLVNARCIKKYYKGRGGHVILDDDTSLPVSPARKDHFLDLFRQKL